MRKTRHELFLERAAALRVKVHELHAIGMKTSHIARQLDITAPRVHQILWPNGKKPKGNGEQVQAQPRANGEKTKPPKAPVNSAASALARKSWENMTPEQRSARQRRASEAAAKAKRAKAEARK